jgi:hypothetical protein
MSGWRVAQSWSKVTVRTGSDVGRAPHASESVGTTCAMGVWAWPSRARGRPVARSTAALSRRPLISLMGWTRSPPSRARARYTPSGRSCRSWVVASRGISTLQITRAGWLGDPARCVWMARRSIATSWTMASPGRGCHGQSASVCSTHSSSSWNTRSAGAEVSGWSCTVVMALPLPDQSSRTASGRRRPRCGRREVVTRSVRGAC